LSTGDGREDDFATRPRPLAMVDAQPVPDNDCTMGELPVTGSSRHSSGLP
jgi:hypothetical protein